MYLYELLCVLGILAMIPVDMYLGLRCYERYIALPRLKDYRKQTLELQYVRAKLAEKAMRKSVNDRIRRAGKKALVKIGKTILFPGDQKRKSEKKAA